MSLIKTIAAAHGQECQHIAMGGAEEAVFLAEQLENQAAQDVADLKASAQMALDKSDLTALRCLKSGALFPAEWQAYVLALRNIVNTGIGPMPVQPAYPEGT